MSANASSGGTGNRNTAGNAAGPDVDSTIKPIRAPGRRGRVMPVVVDNVVALRGARMGLTLREWQVLELAAQSLPNRAIAKQLGIAVGTVKLHLTHAYAKLKVTHRSQAITLVRRLAMDDGDDDVDAEQSWSRWFPGSARTERRREGAVLFNRAEPGDRLYLIEKGEIALQGIAHRVRAGTILGEIAVLTPVRVRTHTAICASDVELRYLTQEQARHFYFTRPDFGFRLLHLITRRLLADRERAR